ncbi:MAG: phosphoribulokinase [Rhodospirillales bacterium]
MSSRHPIITVTGSSGAGTSIENDAFMKIFRRLEITPAKIRGDSYHRYNRAEMAVAMNEAAGKGNRHFSHFGPPANLFSELEELFRIYGQTGTGKRRFYLHNEEDAEPFKHLGFGPGDLTDWEDLGEDTDLLFYQGLHGCVVTGEVDVAQHVDLKIGVVPVINLEWIQKIHRDTSQRGYSEEAVMDTILRRMHDYVHYIIPQFELSDINFQRVPVVDTSDPVIAMDVPTANESLVVIRIRNPDQTRVDFPLLLKRLHNSWMSRRNTIVVDGNQMGLAMDLILTPLIDRLAGR